MRGSALSEFCSPDALVRFGLSFTGVERDLEAGGGGGRRGRAGCSCGLSCSTCHFTFFFRFRLRRYRKFDGFN